MKKRNFLKKSLKLGLAGTALASTLFFPNVVRPDALPVGPVMGDPGTSAIIFASKNGL